MRARIITAAVAIPVVLAAIFSVSPWPLLALLGLAVLLCGFELASLSRVRVPSSGLLWTIGVYEATMRARHGTLDSLGPVSAIGFGVFVLGVLAVALLARLNRDSAYAAPSSGKHFALTFFGNAWHAAPLAMLGAMHAFSNSGIAEPWNFRSPVLLALVPVWAGDTAAMLVGRAFGKRLLAPSISPKKTVEGSAANLIACIGTALAVGPLVEAPWTVAAVAGVSAGVLGQAGDLFQSWLKRSVDKKDSGALLPGHGGLLDRIDALLFAAPVTALAYFWLR